MRREENTVIILEIPSGSPRLILDTGINIKSLGTTESNIVVIGRGKLITWKIPGTCSAICVRANSVQNVMLDPSPGLIPFPTLSPDLTRVALCATEPGTSTRYLNIHDVSTGRRLAHAETSILDPHFTSDGREVWDRHNSYKGGGKIVDDSETSVVKLVPLQKVARPPGVLWESSRGYKVTDDGWVLSPTQKRVLSLPHHWRVRKSQMKWSRSGRVLGLQDPDLPEVVILYFFE